MESLVKTPSSLTRNRHLKQSHCGSWNRHCNMSDSWRMESIASKNSRPTGETDSKNRFMFDEWNRQIHYAGADPEIGSESWVTVEREIIFETEWRWRMESTAHANSRLTNEINRQNRAIVDAWNRQWKLRPYWPEIVSENKVTLDIEISTEIWVPADVWSRQCQRIHEGGLKR